jgi:DNA-binding NarL/FixJ family response regulator
MMKGEHQMIKVLLVDDHPMVRCLLRMRLGLEPDVEILGEARNGGEALSMLQSLAPDVVVMDVAMPDPDGIATTKHICELAPRTLVVMLSLHGDSVTRALAREAGAAAFVEKRAGAEDLLVEIRRAVGSAN